MKTRINEDQNWKFPNKIFKIFLVFILILFLQYSYLSISPVVYGINMKKFASDRNTYSETLYAKRGTIYDSQSNVLALNVSSYTVIAYLDSSRGSDYVSDKQKTAELLSPLLDMEVNYIVDLLSNDLYQVELGPGGRGITELKKNEIEVLELPGIDFIENSKRYYPNGDFASYIIGYAKQNEIITSENKIEYSIDGELGIESKYDDILKGTNGFLQYQQDRLGYKIPDTKETRIDATNGNDIFLTIDSNIQRFLEAAVKDASEQYDPEWMMLGIMDAKTGDILGFSSTPSFDPNIRDIENYENPLVSYLYEPGSTMKTYTYMCAIDKGTYIGDQTYKSGTIKIGDSIVSDWNKVGWGTITFDLGFEYSSNTGIANVLDRFINKDDLKECFNKFGFGEATKIELPREFDGNLEFNYPIEVVTAGFGQGILTTAIQHLQALSIIANDGKMLKPHIIKTIKDSVKDETVYERTIEESDQKVSLATVKKIKELMYNTVNGSNFFTTGASYSIDGFDIIGKTGTAQIYDNASGRYLTGWNDYIYSFSGMFPYDDPEIIVYGAITKPNNGSAKGLQSATKSVLASIAKYKNIFPEDQNDSNITKFQLQSYISKNIEDVKNSLDAAKIKTVIIGDGNKVISQYPYKGDEVLSNDKVFLVTNGNNKKMPNIIGWSRSDVLKLFEILNIKYDISGYGYVKSQSIKPDTLINNDHAISVILDEKYSFSQPVTDEQTKQTQ